jgi:S1-C subfamily serine protease
LDRQDLLTKETRLRQLAFIALLAVAVAAPPPAAAKSDKSRVVQNALVQSVRVEVSAGGKVVSVASGVVVAADESSSWILTNAHVVVAAADGQAGKLAVLVERPVALRLAARLAANGKVPEEDLALLVVDKKLPVAPIAEETDVDVGADVVVIGAPYGKKLSVSSGIVSQLEGDESVGQTAMKTDAPIGYGASGGGVFDVPSGKLVGLVEGYRTARVAFTGAKSEELGFDIPMPGETFLAPPTKIRRFLRKAGLGKLAGLDLALPPALQHAAPPKATAQAKP